MSEDNKRKAKELMEMEPEHDWSKLSLVLNRPSQRWVPDIPDMDMGNAPVTSWGSDSFIYDICLAQKWKPKVPTKVSGHALARQPQRLSS